MIKCGFRGFKKKNSEALQPREPKQLPAWAIVCIDILLIGVALVIFAYFHHVRPRPLSPQTLNTAPQNTYPAANETSMPANTPNGTHDGVANGETPPASPAPDDWGARHESVFTGGATIIDENTYKSANISIELESYSVDGVVYFVQDIYVKSKLNFKTAFADDTYGMGYRRTISDMAAKNNAIAAINGDYYGARDIGSVLRNGEFYRESKFRDVCVLYDDGMMDTFSAQEFDMQTAVDRGAYQVWSFGPMLLENGQPMSDFDSDVLGNNPRTAIGYYEPGHYCFVVVDGRDEDYSNGMTMQELSQLMYDLGCKTAYNLDGGQTSIMMFNGEVVNRPAGGGRRCSDIIFICEPGEKE